MCRVLQGGADGEDLTVPGSGVPGSGFRALSVVQTQFKVGRTDLGFVEQRQLALVVTRAALIRVQAEQRVQRGQHGRFTTRTTRGSARNPEETDATGDHRGLRLRFSAAEP